jgi:hypothetical protein
MNENQRRVVLYGDSLILAGVRAGLESHPDLQVLFLDPSQEKPLDAVRAFCPATFVFDLAAVAPDFQLSLLQEPGLLLVGVDAEAHQALVWSGREEAAVVAADLMDLIDERESSQRRKRDAAEQLEI